MSTEKNMPSSNKTSPLTKILGWSKLTAKCSTSYMAVHSFVNNHK